MRVRSHLILLVSCALIPGLVGAGIAIQKVREGARQSALRALQETVRATALLVDGQMQRSLGALTALGNSSELASGNLQAFYAQAAALDQPPDVWTLLLDETGAQRLNTRVPFGSPLPPAASRERVGQVLATGKPLVSDVFVGPATQKLVTTLYVPARAATPTPLVVAQAFSVEHWKSAALQPQGRADWVIAVLDRTGRFVSRSHRTVEMVGQPARPELVAAAAAASSGMIRHRTLENVEVYDAFARSELTGWSIAVAAPVDSIEASATRAAAPLAFGLLIALLAGATSLTWFGRALLRDVANAMAAADALGRGREPAPVTSSLHELEALHASHRDAGRLLALERRARAVVEAEKTLLLAGEKEAREGAQMQNAAKDQFVAMLGHELRNPLAAISGAIAVLASRGLDARDRHFLDIAQRQSGHLARIVDDLLDAGRMLSGKLTLQVEPLNLGQIARAFVSALQATEAGRAVRLVVADDDLQILGDPVRIEQVLSNLVTNAIKFSPAGSLIHVTVRGEEGMAVLEVVDAGIGIEPELLPRIFEPFVQGGVPGLGPSGIGIGLALVKQLMELHGGDCVAAPNGNGPGTIFTATLPRIAGPGTVAAAGPGSN